MLRTQPGIHRPKIASIVGARPQFIKAAVVSRALAANGVQEQLIHTGQHYDENMSGIFFAELGMPEPQINLAVGSGGHGAQTGRMLESIEQTLLDERPDMVIVYGDTNSTLAGALAAVKLHIPVAHVEAGLRSFNRRMPEEINRVLTDHACDILFVPSIVGERNLLAEGVPKEKIHISGDVMYDAAVFYGAKAERESRILQTLSLERKGYVLATVHRPENTDDAERLETVFAALRSVGEHVPVVLPVHPRTRKTLSTLGLLEECQKKLRMIDPLGYLDMTMLEKNARAIVTDSGGVQKEAFFQAVPCITVRDQTEWTELVDLGWNEVVPPISASPIVEAVLRAIKRLPAKHSNPYGDGNSAERIVSVIRTAVEASEANSFSTITSN